MGAGPPSKLDNNNNNTVDGRRSLFVSSSQLSSSSLSVSSSSLSSSKLFSTTSSVSSSFSKMNRHHHHKTRQFLVSKAPTDPFSKHGGVRRNGSGRDNSSNNNNPMGCVRSAWNVTRLVGSGKQINKWTKKKKKVSMTVLMKLVMLKDWQRVLIRCNLFGNEISQPCIIPLYRPTTTTDVVLTGGDSDTITGDEDDVIWLQVLPIHVACALNPPDQVIRALLTVVKPYHGLPGTTTTTAAKTGNKKMMDSKKTKDALGNASSFHQQQQQKEIDELLPLAGVPIEVIQSNRERRDIHRTDHVDGNNIRRSSTKYPFKVRRHYRQKYSIGPKTKNVNLQSQQVTGRTTTDEQRHRGNVGMTTVRSSEEQRHDDEEQGCRLLDDNANHEEHFERERLNVEQELATNGRRHHHHHSRAVNLSMSSSSSASSSLKVPKQTLSVEHSQNKPPRRPLGQRIRQVGMRSHLLLNEINENPLSGPSIKSVIHEGDECHVSLEASIGDGETNDSGSLRSNDLFHQQHDDTLVDDDQFYEYSEQNNADLPIDGWSSYSSIQFVDEDTDDDDINSALLRTATGQNGSDKDSDSFEYYDAYGGDDYDYDATDLDGEDDDKAMLNQFLSEQGIVLQLTPGGEIQPMPIQESRRLTKSDGGEMMKVMTTPSELEKDPSAFSPTSSLGESNSPHGRGNTSARIGLNPFHLWESLKLGEDRVLPIHIACLYNASAESLQCLLDNFPEGALGNVLGMMPIHMVCLAPSFPDLPFASTSFGGSSDVYSILREHLDYSSQDGTGSTSFQPDASHVELYSILVQRAKVLLRAAPESLFARSVAHSMKPLEYAVRDGKSQPEDGQLTELVSYLELEEKLKIGSRQTAAEGGKVKSASSRTAQDDNLDCSRTHSTSTCSTMASSFFGSTVQHDQQKLSSSVPSSSSMTASPSCLSDLLQSGSWSDAMDLLESDLRLARKWHYGIDHYRAMDRRTPFPRQVLSKSSREDSTCMLWKRLPLHIACGNIDPPPIGLLDLLLKAYRGAASCADPHSGYLPLHLACRTHCDLAVIRTLLHAAPVTTKVVDALLGQLPLHHAILARAPYSVIEVLVHHDPQTVSFPDNKGRTPLMLAQRVYLTTTNVSDGSATSNLQHHPVLSLLELAWL